MQEYRMLYLPEFDTSSLRNSEQTIETNHDSSTDFVMENCKSDCDHFIINNMSCCIGFQFFVCLILLIDCWNSFWMVCFCSELIFVKLSLNKVWANIIQSVVLTDNYLRRRGCVIICSYWRGRLNNFGSYLTSWIIFNTRGMSDF